MNTLENKIQQDWISATKGGDKVKSQVLKNIKKYIMDTKTAPGAKKELDDSDILKIIQKMVKELEKAIQLIKDGGREDSDLSKSYQSEIDILKTYLPQMLSEDEVTEIVAKTIADLSATSMKDMGKVMGFINKNYAGKVDGSMVSRIVKSKLS